MHIADGVLPATFCLAAAGASGVGVYAFSKGVRHEEAPKIGVLAAAAFLASVIHFPVGGVSVHLGLYGLLGVLLGKRSFPVVGAALVMQTFLLQHGGIASIGVNALNMGVGALAAWGVWSIQDLPVRVRSFAAGFVGAMLPAVMMASEFYLADYGRGFFAIAALYSVVAAVEGALTAALVDCFRRLKPEALVAAAA